MALEYVQDDRRKKVESGCADSDCRDQIEDGFSQFLDEIDNYLVGFQG